MDWNLKIPSWDFNEFEQGTISNIDGVSGSSSYGGGQGIKGGFSVDLKLGQVIDSGNEFGDDFKVPSVSQMVLSPSGSSKRARPVNNAIQAASCLVDGCNADLKNCRDYHRRHKVCEVHSKTPQVTINGLKQRFCQQCSRFHSLEEFDEGKRSCRKRLDGHNRRRRKPQPEPVPHGGSLFSSHQGTTMLRFSGPQVYPTASVTNPVWAGIVKVEEDAKLYNRQAHSNLTQKQNPFPESSSSSNDYSGKQFSLFHNARSPKACQPLLTISSSETSSSSDKMFRDGFPARVIHSDCALSLLSSSGTQTSPMSLSQPNSIPTSHPVGPGLSYVGLDHMESIMVPNGDDAGIQCQGGFHMAPHTSRDNETPQTLPFYWE